MKPTRRYSWIAIACGALLGLVGMHVYQRFTERSRFVETKENQTRRACVRNLRLIDSAKTTWALDKNKPATETPTLANLEPYMKSTNLTCPAGGTYTINSLNKSATCSYPGHGIP